MTAMNNSRRLRTAVISGAACTALLAGGAAPALASVEASHVNGVAAVAHDPQSKREFITIHANAKSVRHGGTVRLSGKVFHIRDGSRLTVEHRKGNRWVSLETTTVKHGSYSVKVKLNHKGTEHLRVVHGKTHSAVVTVKVT
ncbi:hypothetical protein BLA24_26705 [Streptomyces cinnamoneus]|uniref:Bacterial Ig domain-containing protein n=1 Tax=Streptomyces cinnamoneus TaxID=53446 RepID=A0A2G1XEF6_STRCJ|nr:hypothetical protein [Streptomyces cinnamoneus]PHQ49613.1 hypothetical protein BLA24_26705 [Streptomyces cinnamoneus]PPT14667.1 hypothetical protein CYQ11_18930 [Streptomyces cinnamoneus]